MKLPKTRRKKVIAIAVKMGFGNVYNNININ